MKGIPFFLFIESVTKLFPQVIGIWFQFNTDILHKPVDEKLCTACDEKHIHIDQTYVRNVMFVREANWDGLDI